MTTTLTGSNWNRVEEIFCRAADLPRTEQTCFLDSVCLEDKELRREVESLLEADRHGMGPVASAIEFEAGSLLEDKPLAGERLGAYRVIREIGRGGMGTVYLAARADDQYQKQVAIKVVKRGMDTADVLGRFRHERQILANLDHAYIARLIDGGTTPDGRPFFVMEYVEGRPIDQYCQADNLDVDSRLRLFLRVCEAVSYAHRGLVVHRDLKPGNILVTAEGVPKLLDFGVAKLLMPSVESGFTATASIGPLTPDYASPEQVRGLPVTTATDVYALGAVLYELLTGSRAQKIATRTPAEIERVICDTEPLRPSEVADNRKLLRRLEGDLDNIILMAMRKEPERRYPSVDFLAEDIRRQLDGRPVLARQDSLAYRGTKYIRRHRIVLSAAVLIFISLVAGVAVALSQARQAEAARQVAEAQRRVADRERGRASAEAAVAKTEQGRSERRLSQIVEHADRSLSDVHSAIERLPGAIEARRKIVASTLDLLEDLSKDAGHDARLEAALSAAYRKVADVQGYPMRPNLGDSAGALANYHKAIQLIDPLLAAEPDNPQYLLLKLSAESRLGELLIWMGQPKQAAALFLGSMPAAQKLSKLRPNDLESRFQESALYGGLVWASKNVDMATSLEFAHRQSEALQRLVKAFPDSNEMKLELATAYSEEGAELAENGELKEAVERYRLSIVLREAQVARAPADVVARRGLMISYGNLGYRLGSPLGLSLGDGAGAREYYGKALAIARDLAKSDGADHLARYDLASALLYYAVQDVPASERAASLSQLIEAKGMLESLVAADRNSTRTIRALTIADQYMGHRLRDLGRLEEAVVEYRQSVATAEKGLAIDASNLSLVQWAISGEESLAGVLASQGNGEQAVALARKAIARAERLSVSGSERDRVAGFLAGAYLNLAAVQATLESWSEAQKASERAVAIWRPLIAAGSKQVEWSRVTRAEALLKECLSHAR